MSQTEHRNARHGADSAHRERWNKTTIRRPLPSRTALPPRRCPFIVTATRTLSHVVPLGLVVRPNRPSLARGGGARLPTGDHAGDRRHVRGAADGVVSLWPWLPVCPGLVEQRAPGPSVACSLGTPDDNVRDCAHKHKAVCSYAGACPALVTALDDVKRASDERLSYYVGRALTLLLQTRRRASRLTWVKEKEA